MTFWERSEDCAEKLLDVYGRENYRISVDIVGWPGDEWEANRVDVYVKSMRDVSLDEYPILRGLFHSLHNARIEVFEYESIDQSLPRHRVLSRLLERSVKRRIPTIAIVPSAMPVSLVESLSPNLLGLLDNSLVAKIRVEFRNMLYLPAPPADPITLVAKANSESAYDRVQWLDRRAAKLGLRVDGKVYLPDNRIIFEYVFSGEPDSYRRKVPVNKLALYIRVLADCADLPGVLSLERREESTHLLYGIGVPDTLLDRILSGIRASSSSSYPLGLMHESMKKGAQTVFMRIASRLQLKG